MTNFLITFYTEILMPLGEREAPWIYLIQKYYSNHISDMFMNLIVLASSLKAYFVFFVLYFIGSKKKRKVLYLLAFLLLCVLLNGFLKEVVQAPRPYQLYPEIHGKYLSSAGGSSFPSGHSQSIAFLCSFLYLDLKEHGFFFLLFVLLVGFSRVYAGVHFPHDVLAGYLLGAILAILAYLLSPFHKNRRKKEL